MSIIERVSVHGGHSGQFCSHAKDSLESVVLAYIDQGFSWVGITEHTPPPDNSFLYPEEKDAGLDSRALAERFSQYFQEARRLQKKYAAKLPLFVAMEIETYSGYGEHVAGLLLQYRPDYIVGSIHHVDDLPIDYSPAEYEYAASKLGGLDKLYCRYFDQQFEMLQRFQPAVVGHFDLIRIFDRDYRRRLQKPEILKRLERNLDFIGKTGLILDYNTRSLLKGAHEPYVTAQILEMARERKIAVVPGDDSHGVDSVGLNIDRAAAGLQNFGFSTNWRKPAIYSHMTDP